MTEELFPRTRESGVVSYAGYPDSETNKGPEGNGTGALSRKQRGDSKRSCRGGISCRLKRPPRNGQRHEMAPRQRPGSVVAGILCGLGQAPRAEIRQSAMRWRGYEDEREKAQKDWILDY